MPRRKAILKHQDPQRQKPHNITHGMSFTPEYFAWGSMMRRCYSLKDRNYRNYGARGVKVCAQWHTFEGFIADMGLRPSARHSIDRINGNGDYEPSNCRWATYTEQNRNRCTTRVITHNGETLTLPEWAERSGIPLERLRRRIGELGWEFGRAINTPVRAKRR